ncbi:MAG: hypothetical protein RSC03_11975, partial [Acinetobacter sp.]
MSTFKTHVDVRSDHFPITATELKKWERQITGELLPQHLAKQFNQQQLRIAAIHDEDWGYQLSFSDSAYKDIFIGCNRYEQNDNLFLIFIHPPQPIIKKYFFKKIDLSTQLSHVSE